MKYMITCTEPVSHSDAEKLRHYFTEWVNKKDGVIVPSNAVHVEIVNQDHCDYCGIRITAIDRFCVACGAPV